MIAKPTVHLNGTSREELHHGYMKARKLLVSSLHALAATYPNARDYYVQRDNPIAQAMREHEARMTAVRLVIEQLEELAEVTMEN